uniref:Neurexin-4 n=1 Tax=Cacopsylla melanoneura TaxID=428564 RepID=A0A8D8V9Y3_9HEMI
MKNLNSLASFCIYSLLQFVHVNSESDYYDCNEPLVDRAAIKATSQLPDREAHNARLNGVNAWSAQSSDFDQHLIFDLGTPMNITGIATQGRAHGTEYVLEYAISYGSNGLDYADYKDAGGNVKVTVLGRPRTQPIRSPCSSNWTLSLRFARLRPKDGKGRTST